MTLEKAIKLQTRCLEEGFYDEDSPILQSIKLGIEAMKRCRDYRKAHFNLPYTPMPGETEDGHNDNRKGTRHTAPSLQKPRLSTNPRL